ncbi:hypothetical protein ABMA28_009788 [Loxostege sticticalis]|uniref:Integrase catalytic domain-containing protein n=1 Tax=Loxostege sticticalis TaxID=481309 RepID=A0ABD0SDM7_LOXSC
MEFGKTMQLDKFDGTNFKQWKFQIKCALRARGLDINKPKPDKDETNQWNKDDGMAMFIITSAMDLKQIALIENCETALQVMTKLESIFEQKSEMNKMMLHERFYQYRMLSTDNIAQHIAKVESLAKQLKENGEEISDTAIITKILSTLPAKFRSLRQAWMSLDPSKQTIINLTARLLDEEATLGVEEENETALLVSKQNRPLHQGDVVYSDVCGPFNVPSVQGMKYFVIFKDAATSFRYVYFLKNKCDVLDCFKKYNAKIKNLFSHGVRVLHSDNGGEYTSKEFKEYLASEGISHELTAPYTPE